MANQILGSYDPEEINLTLGAGFIVEEIGDGGVTISRSEDVSTEKLGITGDPVININRKKNGTATISLRAQSDADKVLREIVASGLLPYFFFTLEEKSTGAKIATQAWVKTQPDLAFVDDVADREWVLGLANADIGITAVVGAAADFLGGLA